MRTNNNARASGRNGKARLFILSAAVAGALLTEARTPDWTVTLETSGDASPRAVRISGRSQQVNESKIANDTRVFACETLTDGTTSWPVRVTIEEKTLSGGTSYRGTIVNGAPGIRVTGFETPFFDRLRLDPDAAALYTACGLGRRLSHFPARGETFPPRDKLGGWSTEEDGSCVYETAVYPGAGLTMPWAAIETGSETRYLGSHDPLAQPKRLRFRWSPEDRSLEPTLAYRFFLEAGRTWEIPESVCEKVSGDWHAAAKRYRRWYDATHRVRAAAPAWTKSVTGQLLVIMRQQNGELNWPYADIPKLCDVAQRNGLDMIGLFGWTEKGHDNTYPDYIPSREAGGVEALKAGIAEAHRRGLRVYIYANGQLQHIGATQFWKDHGARLAILNRDGSHARLSYHKYSDTPDIPFSLCCLWGKPWHNRMYALAEQAVGFGADAILYDQLGCFPPFECYGTGHGHPTPGFSQAAERPAFLRSIADGIRRENPDFAIFTEGLHDTILDSIAFFHGCEYGVYGKHVTLVRQRAKDKKSEAFPELFRYTFPELVTTLRYPSPMVPHAVANDAAVFGCRHEIEVRYAPDRAYALAGKIPTKEDYGTVIRKPDIPAMGSISPADASGYLKGVCDFQRKYAPYLLLGRFVDNEGFTCENASVVAKRFIAADGSSAVLAWNLTDRPTDVRIGGLGAPTEISAPAGTAATGPLPGNALRLFVFGKAL